MFIFEFLRRKKRTEIFTQNFLFTNKLALEAARDIIKGKSREEVIARIEAKTQAILDRDKQGIYSEKIVKQAALQTVGRTKEAISQIAKMEKVVREIRRKEVEEIFS